MPIIVAIFGATCVGKSAVARELAYRLGYEIRHCGELVKERAEQLGIAPRALGHAEHLKIDHLTRSLTSEFKGRGVVMEGTLLDVVLRDCRATHLVELVCSADERLRRFKARNSGDETTFQKRNVDDHTLRLDLYLGRQGREPDYVIDSTTKSIDKVVGEIVSCAALG